MSHPLLSRIRAIRRRVGRLVWLEALAWLLAWGGAALGLLAWGDYQIRFRDPGLRVLASLTLLAAWFWAGRRYLWRNARSRWADVALAERLEARFPAFQDSLASAVEFLAEPANDPTRGSPELRRAVIAAAASRAETVDLGAAVNPRPLRRALIAAGVVLVAWLAGIAADPASARLAVSRLLRPWAAAEWPRTHQLAIRNPLRAVAKGAPLEVEVVDERARSLPDEVWLVIRYPQARGPAVEERLRMQPSQGRMTVRKDAIERPLEYRAVGGDDERMPWIKLAVVEPPALVAFELMLHHPAYLGWPAEAGSRDFAALVGSQVALSGASSKPLRQAQLVGDTGNPLPLLLEADRQHFRLPVEAVPNFVVAETQTYSIELEDEAGLVGGRETRYQVRAIRDLPPTVALDDPPGNVYLTPQATLPLVLTAKDDLGLAEVRLTWTRASDPGGDEASRELFHRSEPPLPSPELAGRPLGDRLAAAQESRRIEDRWELAGLSLAAGEELTFQVVARDFQPAEGRCPPRRVFIVSAEELQNRLAEKQGFLHSELERLLALERDALRQTEAVDQQASEVGQLRKQDLDQLHGGELLQRQVTRGLVGRGEGLREQVTAMQAELANNQLESPELAAQLATIAGALEELEREPLPQAEQALLQAMKAAQNRVAATADSPPPADPADAAEVREPLGRARDRQAQIVTRLEELTAEMGNWDNFRKFHRELTQLRAQQETLEQETRELGGQTLSRERGALSPQQQADLAKLARQQAELARQLARAQERMMAAGQALEPSDPEAAATLADAVHQGQESAAAGKMREAAGQVERNQMGGALENQAAAREALDEMLDILAQRPERDLAQLVAKLRQAEEQLAAQLERQAELAQELAAAAAEPASAQRERELERLAREEREAARDAERLARRLERLEAQAAARATASAGENSAEAGDAGEAGQAQTAAERAEQAQQDLEEAQQALAQRRRQAEEDLAYEQLAKLEDQLRGLAGRQKTVVDETGRLGQLAEGAAGLSPGQAASVTELGRQERLLAEETDALAGTLTAAEVFALALRGAGREMRRAADLLAHRRAGRETLGATQDSLRRLEQLLAALAPDEDQPPEQGGEAGGGEGGGNQPQDANLAVAQLKMIKLWQVDLNQRTNQLEAELAAAERPSPTLAGRYVALGEEQGQLADLVRNLLPRDTRPTADDPEAPPSLDEPPPADAGGLPGDALPVDELPALPDLPGQELPEDGPAGEPAPLPSEPGAGGGGP